MYPGSLILILGAAMLVEHFGVRPDSVWKYLLPAALIALGISVLADRCRIKRQKYIPPE